MSELVEFLNARFDEEERGCAQIVELNGEWGYAGQLVTRIRADVAAQRQIVARYAEHAEYDDWQNAYEAAEGRIVGLGEAVRLLALPYAGHEDYRPEWAPDVTAV